LRSSSGVTTIDQLFEFIRTSRDKAVDVQGSFTGLPSTTTGKAFFRGALSLLPLLAHGKKIGRFTDEERFQHRRVQGRMITPRRSKPATAEPIATKLEQAAPR
jgi:hypothetical protein